MTPEEFAIARRKLDWTDSRVAEELEVTDDEVRAWSAGIRKIPKRHAQMIEWFAAVEDRAAALKSAGIEECTWAEAHDSKPLPEDDEELEAYAKQFEDHAAHCPTCQARERFIRERFPPMPAMPQSNFGRVFMTWINVTDRVPRWARTPIAVLPFFVIAAAIGIGAALTHGVLKVVLLALIAVIVVWGRFTKR